MGTSRFLYTLIRYHDSRADFTSCSLGSHVSVQFQFVIYVKLSCWLKRHKYNMVTSTCEWHFWATSIFFFSNIKESTSAPSVQLYRNETNSFRKVFFAKFAKYLIRFAVNQRNFSCAQHSFRNGQNFSILDAKRGYMTKQLEEQSQLLSAFSSPFRKYSFLRLPLGLSVSFETFCEHVNWVLADIPGTFPCADDVKVQGSTEEHHDIHLLM